MIPGLTTFTNTTAVLTLSSGYTLGLGPGTDKLVTGVKGWDSGAPMRVEKTERMNEHGSFAEPGKRDERVVSVSGQYQAPTRGAAALFVDDLNAYLGDGSLGLLTMDDVDLGTRSARVQLLSPDIVWDKGRNVEFTLDMTAADPRKYGAAEQALTGPPVPGGGLVFPLFGSEISPGVLDFGEPGSNGVATVTNSGSAETFAEYTIQGPVPSTGFTIKETSTGRRLVYAAAIPSGSEVVLNSADGSVLLDGVDRSVYLTVREWVRIPPRTTMGFLFTCTDPGARLTVEVSPAWW